MTMFTAKNHSAMTSAACGAEASFACSFGAFAGTRTANFTCALLDTIVMVSIFVALVLGLSALLGLSLLVLVVSLISLLVLLGQLHTPKEQPRP